jgi:UDP-glucose 4-epimerase
MELIEAARSVTGHEIPAETAERRAGDPAALFADSGKLRRRFAWEPRYLDIREIVETAWRWHRGHPRGYGPGA